MRHVPVLSQGRNTGRITLRCAVTVCALAMTACSTSGSQTADANFQQATTHISTERPAAELAAAPAGPQLFVKPVAENVFSISLRDGTQTERDVSQQHFLLRNAGYVIAHNLCGKMSKSVSSIAFQNHGTGQSAEVTATIVCKAPNGMEQPI